MSTEMFAVFMDRWIPVAYRDTREEAEQYQEYCRRCFQGMFEVRRVSADYPRRFERALESRDGH